MTSGGVIIVCHAIYDSVKAPNRAHRLEDSLACFQSHRAAVYSRWTTRGSAAPGWSGFHERARVRVEPSDERFHVQLDHVRDCLAEGAGVTGGGDSLIAKRKMSCSAEFEAFRVCLADTNNAFDKCKAQKDALHASVAAAKV